MKCARCGCEILAGEIGHCEFRLGGVANVALSLCVKCQIKVYEELRSLTAEVPGNETTRRSIII